MSGCEVGCQNISTLTAARSTVVHSYCLDPHHELWRCLRQLPAALLVSCCLSAGRTDHIPQLSIIMIMSRKTTLKAQTCFFVYRHDNESATASVPLPSSCRVMCELGMQNHMKTKQWSCLMDVLVDNLMLIAMDWWRVPSSRVPKLVSTVICQTCTEFCSRQDRHKFNCTGLFWKISMSMCVASCLVDRCTHFFSSRHCLCSTQVLKSVCDPWLSQNEIVTGLTGYFSPF